MKLYFLINSLAGGGAEKLAINLAKALAPEKIFLLEKEVEYQIENLNLEFLFSLTRKTSSVFKTFLIPFYAKRFSKKIDKNSVVISFLERANYVNVLASFFKKHKTIISVHMSQLFGREKFHPYNFFSKIFYPKADLVVAVSEGIKRELINHYRVKEEKIKVIYNPIDTREISLKEKEPIEDFLKPFIITVGRLAKEKGQWYLLRIFSELKKDFSNLKLLILGDGKLKNYLVSFSRQLNLKTYVFGENELKDGFDVYFLGFQENPFKFISKAEIFVLTSLWEGFPTVLVEALACGALVFSTDCQVGPREILAKSADFELVKKEPFFAEWGVLMPQLERKFKKAKDSLSETEKIWVESLKKALEDKSLKLKYSERAKERAKDFSLEKIIPQWKEILENLKN